MGSIAIVEEVRAHRPASDRRLSTVVVAVLVSLVLAGCAQGQPPPGPGPAFVPAASCSWEAPPLEDPTRSADACRVAPLDLGAPLARHADLLPVSIELYTNRRLTCVPATPRCAVEDNRTFLAAPVPDPHADPSRARALLTLDWADAQVQLQVSPRCHLRGGPASTVQDCLSVPRDGTRLEVTSVPGASTPWRFHVALALPGDPGGAPVAAVEDDWDLTLDPIGGTLTLTGQGTDTPAFALLTINTVRCSEPGAPPPTQVGAAPSPVQHYACTVGVPANP